MYRRIARAALVTAFAAGASFGFSGVAQADDYCAGVSGVGGGADSPGISVGGTGGGISGVGGGAEDPEACLSA
ncbi:hypothetical protein [Hoyosella altamirensis]|uniref:Uncharacterized protein n=1 Tax=Hoyosella altamirensis TaxID=616997 RepID=A0A839RN89_9ACTN|nr:hypothetical protein [Hoyosella altamirensis]MBB3037857.1 hypothetical protein [Hoyosella altamirensis]